MPRFADHLTGIADILHSSAEGGEVRVNYGEETTGEGHLSDVQTWGPDGYIARPNDPSDKGTCQVLYIVDGQQQRATAFRDNRFAAQAGTLEPGDRMIVTDGPSRIYMKRASQRVGMYTEAKSAFADGSKGMVIDLDGEAGNIQIKRGGQMVVLGEDGNVTLVCAGPATQSSIVMTPTTITITASTVNVAGGFVALGTNSDGTLPGKPGLDTVVVGASGQTGIASPKVFAAQY
jgi:hypothetical protein